MFDGLLTQENLQFYARLQKVFESEEFERRITEEADRLDGSRKYSNLYYQSVDVFCDDQGIITLSGAWEDRDGDQYTCLFTDISFLDIDQAGWEEAKKARDEALQAARVAREKKEAEDRRKMEIQNFLTQARRLGAQVILPDAISTKTI